LKREKTHGKTHKCIDFGAFPSFAQCLFPTLALFENKENKIGFKVCSGRSDKI